jgi:hypothetical protein
VNQESLQLKTIYCPLLLKVQQSEEARINFLKNSVKKMMRHVATMGSKISESAQQVQEQTDFVSSETDLRMFIDSHKTTDDYPNEHSYQLQIYKASVDV